MQDSPLSLLPPLIAIIIAVWRKNALLALLIGVLLSFFMAADYNPTVGMTDSVLALLLYLAQREIPILFFSAC